MNKNISRRDFIKGIGALAATAGLSTVSAVSTFAESTTEGSGSYTPGTYSAEADGINSKVKVTMTFDATSITDVQIDASGETPNIGGTAALDLAAAILDAQSINVDSISGATLTSNAVLKAAADCITQAGGSAVVAEAKNAGVVDWLGEAPEIAESEITETLETEVLIVGAGSGGFAAAMTAGEEGLQTLLIEKNEKATIIREDIGAIGSRYQLEGWKEFPEMKFTAMEAVNEIVRYNSGYVDYDLVKVWANESGAMVDWYADILGRNGEIEMKWEASIGDQKHPGRDRAFASGHSPHPVEGADPYAVYFTQEKYLEELGVSMRKSTALVKLEQDENDKVTGIIAQDMTDKHYIRINASKGVIITAGGYATNTDMMLALQPETMKMKISIPVGSTGDGSGIKAMLWAGAAMDPTHESMMFNRAACRPDETAGYNTVGQWFWFGEQPFLKVNLEGKRFANESGPYEYFLHSTYLQPNHTYCDIFDGNSKKYAEQFQEVGCCRLFPYDNGAEPNGYYDTEFAKIDGNEDSFVNTGYAIKAETLEELAEGLNIPVDQFVETVKHYNELAYAGEDTDYGKEPNRLTPIDTPPYYGVRTGAWHLTTLDGCRINTDMQVMREDGTVIEGLYAAGDCSGGFFATTYPNLFTGLACGRTMTFARHAAKHIAENK